MMSSGIQGKLARSVQRPLLAQSGRWPNSYDSFSNFCRDLPKAFLAFWHGVKDMGSSNLRIDEQLKARLDGT